ncbi:glycerophosphodiester phosphodiesterase family protein [Chloroflexi bacterium]|nr:glycerophosphodiester phosphodiesterase family protein [Chloroflexota bacterium]
MSKRITNIAHRKASFYAPENTETAFGLVIKINAIHIDLDVHSSKDIHLVVMHHDTLLRNTNGHGEVIDFPNKLNTSLKQKGI